jgi:hypothetical protein
MPDLVEIANELYALTPREFVSARNDRARQLRDDKPLAARVRELVKPSTAAWATNLLVREKPHEIEQLVELGLALREAQEEVDRDTLRELSTQRRALVRGLAKHAVALAHTVGQPVTAAATIEIEQTLQAAMTDTDAAAAVSSGRLVRSLSADGLEPVDLDGAVAAGLDGVRAAPAHRPKRDTAGEARLALEKAQRAVAEAERESEQASHRLTEAERRLATIDHERDELDAELEDLRDRLAGLESTIADTVKERSAMARERESARREKERAERAVDAARAQLTPRRVRAG